MGNNGLFGERIIYKYGIITLKSWEVLALPPLPNAITSMTVMGVDSTAVTPASSCIRYPYFLLIVGFHTHLIISCSTRIVLRLSCSQEPSLGLADPSPGMLIVLL